MESLCANFVSHCTCLCPGVLCKLYRPSVNAYNTTYMYASIHVHHTGYVGILFSAYNTGFIGPESVLLIQAI
jgi:hypothetical protein